MWGLILLRAIGMGCVLTVLQRHIGLESWEAMLLGFGGMVILGSLYDIQK